MTMTIPTRVIVLIDSTRPLLGTGALPNTRSPGAAQLSSPRFASDVIVIVIVIRAVRPPRAEHSCALGDGCFLWRGCAMSVWGDTVRHHLCC